ncbi:hypothetical protein ACQPZP_06330 [Spirillospora sp. CA-142024]|uniref:hypothetical protein n=1 Tax=Spirillospora sp. CA-142024 TaxID=3240036 RepID=UPI003D948DDB
MTAVAAVIAGLTLAGAGTAHADGGAISGYGYAGGGYWCEPDSRIKQMPGRPLQAGWVRIWVTGSDFNGQGQTMQFKVIDPRTNKADGYSGWFAIPNSGYRDVALLHGTWKFKICATFGGGTPNKAYRWWGKIDYFT